MLIKYTRKHHSIIGSVQLLMWWKGVAIFNQNELIYNVQYWNSTTIVVCSRSIRLQLRTYIFLTQKWIDLKYYASNAKTYTNEIAWLRCNKKNLIRLPPLKLKCNVWVFQSITCQKHQCKSRAKVHWSIHWIFLVTRQTARMQFLCMNPS